MRTIEPIKAKVTGIPKEAPVEEPESRTTRKEYVAVGALMFIIISIVVKLLGG